MCFHGRNAILNVHKNWHENFGVYSFFFQDSLNTQNVINLNLNRNLDLKLVF